MIRVISGYISLPELAMWLHETAKELGNMGEGEPLAPNAQDTGERLI